MKLTILGAYFPLLFAVVAICEDPRNKCAFFRVCLISNRVPKDAVVCDNDRFSGSSNVSYDFLNYQWNLFGQRILPLGYFLPETTSQIQVGVKCAWSLRIHLVPKSGGHDYGKFSFGDNSSMVADLQKMTDLAVNTIAKTAIVGPGFLSGPLAAALYSNGKLMLPNGLCPTVGISYALGGGYSFLSRRYGLVLDNILELELVNWQGELFVANSKLNSDWFWALRGAGGGSFGIVTHYKFKIFSAPRFVVYRRLSYALEQFPTIFDWFQKIAQQNPRSTLNIIFTVSKTELLVEVIDLRHKNQCSSKSVAQNVPLPKFFFHSSCTVLKFRNYLNTVGAYGTGSGDIANATRHEYQPIYFRGTSFYVTKVIDLEKVGDLNWLIQRIPDYVVVEFQLNGGAINYMKPSHTAYVHRSQNIYKVNPDYLGPVNRTTEQEKMALKWQNDFFSLTQQIMRHTESYQNNVDPYLQNYLKRYYGQNLERLIRIKRKYDPTNYFKNPQSIPRF